MNVPVSVVMVVRDEPAARLLRVFAMLAAQEGCGPLDLVVAAPESEEQVGAPDSCRGALRSVTWVDNPSGGRSAGLNRAIRAVRHAIVVRVDARSIFPPDYVARCVARLGSQASVGVVGGVQRACVTEAARRPRAVVRALRNPWLLGGAAYRRPGAGGVVDTVYLGVFRRAELLELEGYDESLDANEDFDLCARYRDAGFEVWLEAGLLVQYEPRTTFAALWSQYRAFGASKVVFWRRTGRRPNRRQRAAMVGSLVLAGTLVAAARRPAVAAGFVAAGAGALVTVDHLADPHERDVLVRAQAVVANGVIMAAWMSGVVGGLAGGGRRLEPSGHQGAPRGGR